MAKDELPGDLVTTRRAAEIVRSTRQNVVNWVKSGKLRGWKVAGARLLVSEAEVRGLVRPVARRAAAGEAHAAAARRLKELGVG